MTNNCLPSTAVGRAIYSACSTICNVVKDGANSVSNAFQRVRESAANRFFNTNSSLPTHSVQMDTPNNIGADNSGNNFADFRRSISGNSESPKSPIGSRNANTSPELDAQNLFGLGNGEDNVIQRSPSRMIPFGFESVNDTKDLSTVARTRRDELVKNMASKIVEKFGDDNVDFQDVFNYLNQLATAVDSYLDEDLIHDGHDGNLALVTAFSYLSTLKDSGDLSIDKLKERLSVAVLVATKFAFDTPISVPFWAEISGIYIDDLLQLESDFAVMFNYNFFVDEKGLAMSLEALGIDQQEWDPSFWRGVQAIIKETVATETVGVVQEAEVETAQTTENTQDMAVDDAVVVTTNPGEETANINNEGSPVQVAVTAPANAEDTRTRALTGYSKVSEGRVAKAAKDGWIKED